MIKIRGTYHIKSLQLEGCIAAQIETKRQNINISEQELADLADVSKSTIGGIEAGLTRLRVDTLLKISKALETPFIIEGTVGDDHANFFVQT